MRVPSTVDGNDKAHDQNAGHYYLLEGVPCEREPEEAILRIHASTWAATLISADLLDHIYLPSEDISFTVLFYGKEKKSLKAL